jgi:hypothetical protein
MSSFYKQIPPTQGSSYYPITATGSQNLKNPNNFDHSIESDEANVHLVMNSLMIQVGN